MKKIMAAAMIALMMLALSAPVALAKEGCNSLGPLLLSLSFREDVSPAAR
jgi:hypothetical protein